MNKLYFRKYWLIFVQKDLEYSIYLQYETYVAMWTFYIYES